MSQEFFVALMSDSSYKNHPTNKTTGFTTELAQPLQLFGDWRVALAEIHYQHTINNVTGGNNSITVGTGEEPKIECEIPEGHYGNLQEIIDAINFNWQICKNNHPEEERISLKLQYGGGNDPHAEYLRSVEETKILQPEFLKKTTSTSTTMGITPTTKTALNPPAEQSSTKTVKKKGLAEGWAKDVISRTKRSTAKTENIPAFLRTLSVEHSGNDKLTISFNGRLAMQFGYAPGVDIIKNPPTHKASLFFGYHPELLIYTDLIQPQIYGDIHGQILRTVPLLKPTTRFGDVVIWSSSPMYYMKLLQKEFKTVRIDLRTSSGDPPAIAFGTSHVLLHFKKFD